MILGNSTTFYHHFPQERKMCKIQVVEGEGVRWEKFRFVDLDFGFLFCADNEHLTVCRFCTLDFCKISMVVALCIVTRYALVLFV